MGANRAHFGTSEASKFYYVRPLAVKKNGGGGPRPPTSSRLGLGHGFFGLNLHRPQERHHRPQLLPHLLDEDVLLDLPLFRKPRPPVLVFLYPSLGVSARLDVAQD